MELVEFTKKQMKEAQTSTIVGVILKGNLDGMIVINPCLCVQDTQEHPCRCTDIKLLISTDDIIDDIESLSIP